MNRSRLCVTVGLATVIAGLVASETSAVPLTEVTKIGGFNSAGFGGTYGFIYGAPVAGVPGRGLFGAEFNGLSLVDSITITQYTDAGRNRPKNVRVYTDQTHYVTVTFVNTQAVQTVDFKPFNGGQPILTSAYVLLAVQDEYGAGDPNFGVMSYSFSGTYIGPADVVNLNASGTASMTNPLGGYGYPAKTVDGNIVSRSTGDSPYWTRDAIGPDSLTVTYSSPQDVASIGLGWAADTPSRDMPKFVTITDSHSQSAVITNEPLLSQYGRYKLAQPFTQTTSLTITMPPAAGTSADATNWYINGDANYGITEFQAFPPPPKGTLMTLR